MSDHYYTLGIKIRKIIKRALILICNIIITTLKKTLVITLLTAAVLSTLLLIQFILSLLKPFILVDFLNYEIVLEYFKAGVWPAVILIALYKFNGDIKTILSKIKSFQYGKITANLTTSPANQLQPEDKEALQYAESHQEEYENLSQQEYENKIYRQLDVQLAFERTYRAIFGTQLGILRRLSLSPLGLRADELLPIYNIYAEKMRESKQEPTSFQNYMNYLIGAHLVDEDVDNPGVFKLSFIGKLFLRYLLDQGIGDPYSKPL